MSVCVILPVCFPHDKTKTAEIKITKLGIGIVHHNTSPNNAYYVKNTKGDRMAGVSYALYRVPILYRQSYIYNLVGNVRNCLPSVGVSS